MASDDEEETPLDADYITVQTAHNKAFARMQVLKKKTVTDQELARHQIDLHNQSSLVGHLLTRLSHGELSGTVNSLRADVDKHSKQLINHDDRLLVLEERAAQLEDFVEFLHGGYNHLYKTGNNVDCRGRDHRVVIHGANRKTATDAARSLTEGRFWQEVDSTYFMGQSTG